MDIDFLAIGDTVIDAFIRLKDASVNCDIDNENCKLCMNFGDKLPYEFVEVLYAVGNSANASAPTLETEATSARSSVTEIFRLTPV